MMLTPDYLTTNQSEECPWADHALLLEHFKMPYYPLLVRIHSFEGISPLWPPLPGKAILFCCIQNAVSSVQFSYSVISNSLRPHRLQHTRPPCASSTPVVYTNPCPWSWWCHPTISSPVIPISSCLKSFPASGSFQMSQFRESHFLGRLIRSLGVPKERGVWNSQGGRKDKLFSFSTFLRII